MGDRHMGGDTRIPNSPLAASMPRHTSSQAQQQQQQLQQQQQQYVQQLLHRVQRQHRIHGSAVEESYSLLTTADAGLSLYPLHAQPQQQMQYQQQQLQQPPPLQQLQQQPSLQQLQQQQLQQILSPHAPHSTTGHAYPMYTPVPPFRDHSSPAALMHTNELLAGACLPGRCSGKDDVWEAEIWKRSFQVSLSTQTLSASKLEFQPPVPPPPHTHSPSHTLSDGVRFMLVSASNHLYRLPTAPPPPCNHPQPSSSIASSTQMASASCPSPLQATSTASPTSGASLPSPSAWGAHTSRCGRRGVRRADCGGTGKGVRGQ